MYNNEEMIIQCSIVRGGTSKAIFIMKNELPENPQKRDNIILALFGSPSLRQLDGLGGADITTSKLAIIGPATIPEADVDYTFGQVSMQKPFVDYGGNCGNISSGVGPYAINHGLVPITEPVTTVRIHLTNSGHILIARVPVKNGRAAVDGECSIGGVPGTAAPIEMDWKGTLGSTTGHVLPTGNPMDELVVGEKSYVYSVVDAGNTVIYLKAADLGLSGKETPAQINGNRALSMLIEEIRGKVCQQIGLVEHWEDAAEKIPYQPFLALLSEADGYDIYTGGRVEKSEVDIVARISVMLEIVKAYPGTATASTGVAARIPGTIVHDFLSESSRQKTKLNIGHPTGVITVTSVAENSGTLLPVMKQLSFLRTARVLMDGYAYVRQSVL